MRLKLSTCRRTLYILKFSISLKYVVTEQVNHVLRARDTLSEALYKYSRFTRAPLSSIEYYHILHFISKSTIIRDIYTS